jgi:hypothetical protein
MRDLVRQPMKRVVLRSKVTAPYWRRRFNHFGEGAILHKPTWVYGPQQMALGAPARVVGEVDGVDAGAEPVTERLF